MKSSLRFRQMNVCLRFNSTIYPSSTSFFSSINYKNIIYVFPDHPRLVVSLFSSISFLDKIRRVLRTVRALTPALHPEVRLHSFNSAGGRPAAVALGKFDALHRGHRELALQAARLGSPWLVTFSGMAEVLKWERRLPIVAPCDRARVLALWSADCSDPSRFSDRADCALAD